MEITDQKQGDIVVISVKGRMDAISAPEFEKDLDTRIGQGQMRFVIDLADLDYISSAGLRSILALAKKVKTGEGMLHLAALKEPVKEVFDISGFSSIIPIFDSVDTACS
ncbi:MAG: STAS domain-containing protein [Desulfobacteraceae bacterium]|jgi:anti-anti-sigma factor